MNRSFDIFRMSANGADADRGTGREDQMRARTNHSAASPFEHGAYRHDEHHRMAHPEPYGGFIGDRDRFERHPVDVERDRQHRAAHEMYPAGYHEARYAAGYHDGRRGYPPQASSYGNVPYDQMSGRPGQQGPWRGRDEEHDFWGRDRHPHDQPHHDHGAHPGAHGLWERVKGVFTGKGPKNYVRADERIREDVCEHLFHHPYVDASDIEVVVAEGEVTLSGTVEARLVKRAAEECCEHVRGVKDVHNHLRVRRPAPGEAAR